MKANYDMPAVRHAIRILEVLSDSGVSLGVSEICRMVDLNKNMVFRILTTLLDQGWVYQDEPGPKYRISMVPYRITSKPVNRMSVVTTSQPILRRLWEETGESVYMAVMHGYEALYVQHYEAVGDVRIAGRIGGTYPLHCTAPGKVLLAYSEPDFPHRLAREKGLHGFTERTIVDVDRLLVHLASVREHGYALDNEEYGKGILCLSVPVFGCDGSIQAAMGVSVSTIPYDIDSLRNGLGSRVMEAGRNASARLGYEQADR